MPDVQCQTPECQDAAFLQSADFFFFSAELQRTVHSAQLLCMGAGVTACYGAEAHNDTLFVFCLGTINRMVPA